MSALTDRVDAAQLAHAYALSALERATSVEAEHLREWMESVQSNGRDDAMTLDHGTRWQRSAQHARAARDRVATTLRALEDALKARAREELP